MPESTADGGECVHHWMLAAPGPDGTAATCNNCGASRRFAPEARPTLRASKSRRARPAGGSARA